MGDAEFKHSASQGMKSTHVAPEIDHSMRCTFVVLTDRQDYPFGYNSVFHLVGVTMNSSLGQMVYWKFQEECFISDDW